MKKRHKNLLHETHQTGIVSTYNACCDIHYEHVIDNNVMYLY